MWTDIPTDTLQQKIEITKFKKKIDDENTNGLRLLHSRVIQRHCGHYCARENY